MRNLRLLCLAALLAFSSFSLRIYLQELRSPWFDLSSTRSELRAIEDREQLIERVDKLITVLQKSDERIHDWRSLTARAWGSGAFMMAMVLIGTFVWNKEPSLIERIQDLEGRDDDQQF